MTDDLDDLKAAMRAATPAPDPARRAAHIALAEKNFAARQGSQKSPRQTFDRPKPGLFKGVRKMFQSLSLKGAMTATTALAAVGLVVFLPQINVPGEHPKAELRPLSLDASSSSSHEDAPAAPAEGAFAPVPAPAPAIVSTERAPSIAMPADMLLGRALQSAPKAKARKAESRIAPLAQADQIAVPGRDGETYPDVASNPLKITAEDPVSTFSIDVDTASYGIVRSYLGNGQLPPSKAVRVEEMINYFPYDHPAPEAGEAPFRPTVAMGATPWNPDTLLVHIAIQGERPVVADRPPLNLVFLIDTSGSMNQPNKLPLLRQSLSLMLGQLTEQDRVAIVTYAGSAGQALAPTVATDRAAIMGALDDLRASGSTAGQAGLQQAYALADEMARDGAVSRVLLATDGDFNVGLSDPDALTGFIAKQRDRGTYLSVLGFGRGNLDDATMQALAQNGNGTASYIDTLSEAQKVLVDQLSGALFPIADDVKIQVEFNPARVAEYRLIGYETRILRREDFNNDRVDAGDIGAGHSVTALYEITPVGSAARLSDPLRYQSATQGDPEAELGYLKLRYKTPGASDSILIETPITQGQISPDMQFATAIAGFGQLLKGANYLGDWGWDEAIAMATQARGVDAFGYRAEAIRLMRLAQSLSAR